MQTDRTTLAGSLAENLLTLIAFSEKSCSLVRSSVEPELFSSAIYRDIVKRCYAYIDRYGKPPADHLPDLMEDVLTKGDQNATLCGDILNFAYDHWNGGGVNEQYVIEQLERFIRLQTLKIGVTRAVESLSEGDDAQAEVELEKALHTRLALFNPGLTLEEGFKTALHNPRVDVVNLGIKQLDQYSLGPARGELLQFIAPPKRGKTWFLVHICKRALIQRLNVVYITLEISQELIWQRLMQSFFSVARRKVPITLTRLLTDDLGRLVKLEKDKMQDRLALDDPGIGKVLRDKLMKIHGRGNVIIKGFPSGMLTLQGLRAYLDALQRIKNFTPDVLVVDYVDMMSISVKDYRLDLGQLMVGLRGIAVERNLAAVTAKKSNRTGANARLVTAEHSGEDYSGAFTVDTTFTYTQTTAEHELGLARLFVDSTRVGEQDRFVLLLSQAYKIGQFCLGAADMTDTYWSHVDSLGGKSAPSQPQS